MTTTLGVLLHIRRDGRRGHELHKKAADEAVLALYLADADWAQYASKLDIWWNYNGPYKTQPVFPTN